MTQNSSGMQLSNVIDFSQVCLHPSCLSCPSLFCGGLQGSQNTRSSFDHLISCWQLKFVGIVHFRNKFIVQCFSNLRIHRLLSMELHISSLRDPSLRVKHLQFWVITWCYCDHYPFITLTLCCYGSFQLSVAIHEVQNKLRLIFKSFHKRQKQKKNSYREL